MPTCEIIGVHSGRIEVIPGEPCCGTTPGRQVRRWHESRAGETARKSNAWNHCLHAHDLRVDVDSRGRGRSVALRRRMARSALGICLAGRHTLFDRSCRHRRSAPSAGAVAANPRALHFGQRNPGGAGHDHCGSGRNLWDVAFLRPVAKPTAPLRLPPICLEIESLLRSPSCRIGPAFPLKEIRPAPRWATSAGPGSSGFPVCRNRQ